jgi:Protein of unknown function (DUF2846)
MTTRASGVIVNVILYHKEMPMIRVVAYALVVGVAISGCASTPMAPAVTDASAKSYVVDPGKANLYVYRNDESGVAPKMPVLIDNIAAGETMAKTFVFKQVVPGNHVVVSKGEKEVTLLIDAKAGQNYFVWQEVKMGKWEPQSRLHLVDETVGKAGVNECKLAQ